jgi:hypothetical protein
MQQSREQIALDRMVASVTRIQFPLDFLLNQIFACFCRFQKFELWYIFKGSFSSLYVTILPCILVTRLRYF